jgi:hypothetical protein
VSGLAQVSAHAIIVGLNGIWVGPIWNEEPAGVGRRLGETILPYLPEGVAVGLKGWEDGGGGYTMPGNKLFED